MVNFQILTFPTVVVRLIKIKMARTELSSVLRDQERTKLIKNVMNTMDNHIMKLVIQKYHIIMVTWLHIVMVL